MTFFGDYRADHWNEKSRVHWGASEMRKDGEVIGY